MSGYRPFVSGCSRPRRRSPGCGVPHWPGNMRCISYRAMTGGWPRCVRCISYRAMTGGLPRGVCGGGCSASLGRGVGGPASLATSGDIVSSCCAVSRCLCRRLTRRERFWPGGCHGSRPAMIHRRQLGAVGTGGALQLCLCGCGARAPIASGRGFRSRWPCRCSTSSAVVAYASARSIIENTFPVYVSNHRLIHIIHGTVVVERTVVPISSGVADPDIAETIVDATIKSDLRAPVASMPDINTVAPTPVSRGPKRSDERREHPGAGYPIIALGSVGPIAWSPDISCAGTKRLRVRGQQRRCDGDRNRDPSKGCGGHYQQRHYEQ